MAWLKDIFKSSDKTPQAQGANPQAPLMPLPDHQEEASNSGKLTEREQAVHSARNAYWDDIGTSDADVITYVVNPMFQGAPAWPNVRQAYRIVRTADTLIIASEGLSDPYPDEDKNAERCGFGMEVFIEVPGLQSVSPQRIRESWVFAALEMFAQNVANFGGIIPHLESQGILSMELPLRRAPKGWMKENGGLGALIGVPISSRLTEIKGVDPKPLRIVPLTLLRPDEVDACGEKGAEARTKISEQLIAGGTGHLTDVSRESVL